MKKFKLLIFLFVFISLQLLTLSGCSGVSSYQKSIYDDNTKIIKQGDSYNFKNRLENSTKEESSVKFGTFYGMDTIWEIKSQSEGTITIEYNSVVNKGKFKCVLINEDNEIINIFEQSEEGTKTFNIKEGKSRIKIVGNNAGGEYKLKINTEGDIDIRRFD